ncbi:signal recognition particle 19 kDa protein isoform X4 [Pipistrellus kuhlii]|uniref:signal recognition particle 19 kDa protein isoform X4 n=1 Tax=Pipistrellus kuhlii TaxID=59472 RepID=UPI001E274761|nr:signal recognition particle 19 kDa protein isoform X4 [Pipistrellus kuhlii]
MLATAHAPKTPRFEDTREKHRRRLRTLSREDRAQRHVRSRDSGAERQVPEQTDGERPGTPRRSGGQDFRRKWGCLGNQSSGVPAGLPAGLTPVGAGGDGLRRGAVPGRPGQVCLYLPCLFK